MIAYYVPYAPRVPTGPIASAITAVTRRPHPRHSVYQATPFLVRLSAWSRARKIRENRLRRMAKRQGFNLVKIRRLDPFAADYGRYRVETADGVEATRFASTMGWGLTLDEVEKRLTSPRRGH
jgi:hypothetical protein